MYLFVYPKENFLNCKMNVGGYKDKYTQKQMSHTCMSSKTVGVLGGGQLARMMAFAAHRMGIKLITLDPKGEDSPAGQVTSECFRGDFKSVYDVYDFGCNRSCDILTTER